MPTAVSTQSGKTKATRKNQTRQRVETGVGKIPIRVASGVNATVVIFIDQFRWSLSNEQSIGSGQHSTGQPSNEQELISGNVGSRHGSNSIVHPSTKHGQKLHRGTSKLHPSLRGAISSGMASDEPNQ